LRQDSTGIKEPRPISLRFPAVLTAVALTSFLAQRCAADGSSFQAASAPESGSSDVLLKPPPMDDPRRELIRNAVRAAYPELFSHSAPPGWVGVTLLMNRDGTLYKSYKDEAQPRPYYPSDLKAFDAMAVDYEYRGDRVQLAMRAGSNGATGISVRAYYLKPISDKTRDFALVRASVNARYGTLYTPVTSQRVTELTVLMTASGAIERAQTRSVKAVDADIAPTTENFAAMGIPRERIGPINKVMLYQGAYEGRLKSERLLVIYAWPRRVGELAPEPWHPWQPGPMAPNDDLVVDRAIAEKYFPDLYTYTKPENELNADFWVLLDHEGHVRATGRRYMASGGDLKLYVESLYPGIRTDGFEPVEFKGDHGHDGVVNFTWLAADSPVTDLTKADLSKRSDVVFYAEITGDGNTTMTNLVVFKFGSSAIAVDDKKELDLQVTGSDAGADMVLLRARIQRVPHASPSEVRYGMPRAVEKNWTAETSPIQVRYGHSADVLMADQDHHIWKVSLHPDHMRGAIH
jgi:hypothetical protein